MLITQLSQYLGIQVAGQVGERVALHGSWRHDF
jgi:hypothetical protein